MRSVMALLVIAAGLSVTAARADDMPVVKLETSKGDIYVELDSAKAPISTENFLRYVKDGFYNGTIFHRVIPTFMIQGGGFTADLTEKKDGLHEPIKNEWKNGLKNKRGTLAMARTQEPDSATAQFFINVVDNDFLDKPQPDAAYAVFGKVVAGMSVVDAIKDVETKADPKLPMGKVVPSEPVVIKSATLVAGADKAKFQEMAKAEAEKAAKADADAKSAREKAVADLIEKIEKETSKKVEKSASGLMWVVLKDGSGEQPKPTDIVEVHYTGWLTDGKKFDSSVDRGSPATFPLNRVIKGWTEGVSLMKVGEKRKLIVPPDLGYGSAGARGAIPPNAWLIFDVELLSIKQ